MMPLLVRQVRRQGKSVVLALPLELTACQSSLAPSARFINVSAIELYISGTLEWNEWDE
jgi:hypothetical protein